MANLQSQFEKGTSTSATLLKRIRDSRDDDAWRVFAARYWRLVYWFARRSGMGAQDAEDIVQEVFGEVARSIAAFEYDSERGRFRGLLRTITQRRVVDRLRKHRGDPLLSAASDRVLDESKAWRTWEQEERRALLMRTLTLASKQVEPATFQAFQLHVLDGWAVGRTANFLGISADSVYAAKSRVLAKVRAIIHEDPQDD